MGFHKMIADLSENPVLSLIGAGPVRSAEEIAPDFSRKTGSLGKLTSGTRPLSKRSGKKTFPCVKS